MAANVSPGHIDIFFAFPHASFLEFEIWLFGQLLAIRFSDTITFDKNKRWPNLIGR